MHGGLDPEGENSVQTSCMIVCKEDVLYNGLGGWTRLHIPNLNPIDRQSVKPFFFSFLPSTIETGNSNKKALEQFKGAKVCDTLVGTDQTRN